MNRTTRCSTFSFALALLLGVTSASLVACKKDGAGAGGQVLAGATGTNPLALMPADRGLIAGVNLKQASETELFAKFKTQLTDNAELKKFQTVCGMEATQAVERIWIGTGPAVAGAEGAADSAEKQMVVILKTGMNETVANKCLNDIAASDPNAKITIAKEGKLTLYTNTTDNEKLYAAWVDANTVVMTPGMKGDKTYLETVLAGATKASDNKTLTELIGKVDSNATMWAAGVLPSESPVQMEGASQFYMHLKYEKSLDLLLGLRHANAEQAKKTAETTQKQVDDLKASPQGGMFAPYLASFKVEPKDNDAVLTLSLTTEQITQLTNQLMGLLPMLMGGGM